MLPACRTEGDAFAIPQFTRDPRDGEGLMDEWQGFHTAFRRGFARSEPRDHVFHDMVGQFSDLDRTSIEPMALRVEGGNVRAMPRCLSDVVWDDAQRLRTYHRFVDDEMGDPEGVVSFEASGFPQKGRDSVGVARPYGGALGNVENGHVGVCAASASRPGDARVDKRLFMPEPWLTAAYARRRTPCKGPHDRGFPTTPQCAVAMGRERRDEGGLPFTYVVADGLDGQSPELLEAVEAERHTSSCVAIPAETRGWLPGPVMQPKP